MIRPKVSIASVITTDKCSAACVECCFKCSPHNSNMLNYSKIKKFIDELIEADPDVEVLVFTGGEATLLGKELFNAIRYAYDKGLATRIVTNGWWGTNQKSTQRMVQKFIKSGLTEINFSTGDNHQEWVSINHIINACYETTLNNIRTVVSIEAFDGANYTASDFFSHPRIIELQKRLPNTNMLSAMESPWVSINQEKDFYHKNIKVDNSRQGCDSILSYIGINEVGELVSCCGLTQKFIPEMNLSQMYPDGSIKDMLSNQSLDIIKIWLWLDGPQYIYNTLLDTFSCIPRENNIIHACEYCVHIYNNEKIQEAIKKYLTQDRINELLNRYQIKLYMLDLENKKEVF